MFFNARFWTGKKKKKKTKGKEKKGKEIRVDSAEVNSVTFFAAVQKLWKFVVDFVRGRERSRVKILVITSFEKFAGIDGRKSVENPREIRPGRN